MSPLTLTFTSDPSGRQAVRQAGRQANKLLGRLTVLPPSCLAPIARGN